MITLSYPSNLVKSVSINLFASAKILEKLRLFFSHFKKILFFYTCLESVLIAANTRILLNFCFVLKIANFYFFHHKFLLPIFLRTDNFKKNSVDEYILFTNTTPFLTLPRAVYIYKIYIHNS